MTEETPSTKILMIDIETLDTAPTAVILQIAVSVWDGINEPTIQSWCISTHQKDRTISVDAVRWWMDRVSEGVKPPLTNGCISSLEWVLFILARTVFNATEVWSQGRFDIDILSHAYNNLTTTNPFTKIDYHVFRDLRTLTSSIPREEYEKLKVNPTNPHNAESDCMAQMKTLINIKNYLSHEH